MLRKILSEGKLGGRCKMKSFVICILFPTKFFLSYRIKSCDVDEACYVLGRREMQIRFWWGNLKERDNLENPNLDGNIIGK
jgi:hypothetical protein